MIDFSTNIDITHKSNIGMGLHVWKAVFIEKFPEIPTFWLLPLLLQGKVQNLHLSFLAYKGDAKNNSLSS